MAITTSPKFITVEGIDGAGKSTQIECIAQCLADQGLQVIRTREPGGTALGEALRDLLLANGELKIDPQAELLLMFAARIQHYRQVIEPALTAGKWVISDRFTDASFAYQGARGIGQEHIAELERWTLQRFEPGLTLLLDLPLESGHSRLQNRGQQDRFDLEGQAYKQRVKSLYLQRAKTQPERIKVIDASGSVAAVSAQVLAQVNAFIQSQGESQDASATDA